MSDGRLWLNDLTGLRITQRENGQRTTKVAEKIFCGDRAEPMLIFGKNGFTASIAEDGSSYATFFHEEYRSRIAEFIICSDAEKVLFLYPAKKQRSEFAIAEPTSNLYTLEDKVYLFRKIENDGDTKFYYLDVFKD